MKHRIVSNFLTAEEFNPISKLLLSSTFEWYYSSSVARRDSATEKKTRYFAMTHMFYRDHNFRSSYSNLLDPIIKQLDPKALLRIKANLFPSSSSLHNYPFHIDYPYSHKTAIYTINTNNGFTFFEDKTKVGSKENQMLFFDGSKPHASTTCTDQQVRINIGFNYL